MAKLSKPNPYSPEQHLKYFAEFCAAVVDVGGATPHLTMVGESARGLQPQEKLWRGGCYAATYNYAAAEIIWRTWEPEHVVREPARWAGWVKENWKALPLRRERKAVNNPDRLAECVISFAEWVPTVPQQSWANNLPSARWGDYQAAWDSFTSVRYMGRYIAIRFLEYMRRHLDYTALVMPDLRPRDAPYPRQSLSLMYPQFESALRGNDSTENVNVTHAVAADCRRRLETVYGVKLDYYTLQSLLCEYKQSVLGQRQYPGRSVDSELSYWDKVYKMPQFANLAEGTQMWEVRKRAFPAYVLGEEQGWASGARDVLGKVLVRHGYTWSDRKYDYAATLASGGDFSKPVRRMA
jgi:hypothetical protein